MTATLGGAHAAADPGLLGWLDASDRRYEVLDGAVVVTPPARLAHERLVPRLAAALLATVPDDHVVLGPNYAVRYRPGSFLLPDLLVARADDCDDDGTRRPPLVVVEVLSPSTRRRDLGEKQQVYAELGVPHYWLLDPDAEALVLRLVDGAYVPVRRTAGRLQVDVPFPVALQW